jgi:hypothetical protein
MAKLLDESMPSLRLSGRPAAKFAHPSGTARDPDRTVTSMSSTGCLSASLGPWIASRHDDTGARGERLGTHTR